MTSQDNGALRATTNLDQQRFEQVDKDKVYFHAEQDSEEFEADTQIETLSLRQLKTGSPEAVRAFGEALRRGMTEIGFVYLEDHGIDPSLFEETDRRTRAFFEETPEAEKARFLAARSRFGQSRLFPVQEKHRHAP